MCHGKVYENRELIAKNDRGSKLVETFYKQLPKLGLVIGNGKWLPKTGGMVQLKKSNTKIIRGASRDMYAFVSKTLGMPWKDLARMGLKIEKRPFDMTYKTHYYSL